MVLLVRKAQLKDVVSIVHLHVDTWRKSYQRYVADEILNLPYFQFSEERVKKMKVPIQDGLVYVAEENDKIVGFAGLLNPIDIETEIKVFYVCSDNQRQGVGQKIFDYIKEDLIQNGCEKLTLWTMKNYPPSNNFYVKNMGVLSGREMRLKINIDTVEYVFDLKRIQKNQSRMME